MFQARCAATAVAAVGLCLGSPAAFAQEYPRLPTNISHMTLGYTYFNRPEASLERHDSDLAACLGDATKTISADAALSGHGQNGLLGDLIQGGLSAAANRGTVASALENCMLVRGWRVILLPESAGSALAAKTDAQVAAQIAPQIGSATPEGQVFRTWNNDAANNGVERWSLRPPHINDGMLSLRLLNMSNIKEAQNAAANDKASDVPTIKRSMLKPDKSWPTSRLEPEQLKALPSGSVVLIVGMSGGITGLEFERVGKDPRVRPVTIDHEPDRFRAFGKWAAYVIPAGHWRVRALTKGLLSINMCLGSPSFDAAPGDSAFRGLL